ncbi:MAG: hypothetical protein WDN26_21805 [Chitinophagaceae bacterium]
MPASPFSVRRFVVIFSIAWFVLMADHAMLLFWYDFPLQASILDSIISNILLLGICLLVINTIRYYLPKREQYTNIIAMCIVLTIIWLVIIKWLLGVSLSGYENYSSFLSRSLVIRFSIAFLIVGITTTTSMIWYNWQEQQKSEKREVEAEKTHQRSGTV